MTVARSFSAQFGDVNRLDASGKFTYRYSLTQRVFLIFQRAGQALDREDVMALLNIGAVGLKHAMARLMEEKCIQPAAGRYGFYELVPGATLPVDTRGKNPKSYGNRGKRANWMAA